MKDSGVLEIEYRRAAKQALKRLLLLAAAYPRYDFIDSVSRWHTWIGHCPQRWRYDFQVLALLTLEVEPWQEAEQSYSYCYHLCLTGLLRNRLTALDQEQLLAWGEWAFPEDTSKLIYRKPIVRLPGEEALPPLSPLTQHIRLFLSPQTMQPVKPYREMANYQPWPKPKPKAKGAGR